MIQTHEVYNNRKEEIEFYYSVMVDAEDETKDVLNTIDNQLFFRIMKSNFLLMLYNLVEATFTTGMLEIYDKLKQENCTYSSVIDEIQKIWRDYKVKEVYKPDSPLVTYTNRVKSIVTDITQNTPIALSRSMLGINGNLNAKQIKDICDKHRIRYRVIDDQLMLEKVKSKRNSLAHGDESFSRCARDLTLNDLKTIKDIVLKFICDILDGMDNYYDGRQYMRQVSNS